MDYIERLFLSSTVYINKLVVLFCCTVLTKVKRRWKLILNVIVQFVTWFSQ